MVIQLFIQFHQQDLNTIQKITFSALTNQVVLVMVTLDALMPCQTEAHCSARSLLVPHIRKTDSSKANNTTIIYNASSSEPNFF